MKLRAPVVTLAAVVVLGAGLLAVNLAATPTSGTPAAARPIVAAAAPATTAAPEPAPPPVVAEKVWAGRSTGREVTVAIAVKGGRAVAYVCDGKKVEAWLQGTLTGDQLALTGPNGARIDGTASEATASGTIAADGRSWPYTAKGVQAPEGLYEGRADVRGVATRIGWIVVGGTQTGLRRSGGVVAPAPVLDAANPGRVVVDGSPVTVRSGTELVAS